MNSGSLINRTSANSETFDVVIAGGGIGGCVAALALHRHAPGARVLLLEGGTFPHHKVCGEFFSPEGWTVLQRLDADTLLRARGAHPITQARVLTAHAQTGAIPLPAPAWAISRWQLDDLLWQYAGAVCEARGGAHVRHISRDGNAYSVQTRDTTFRARFVIDAMGRTARHEVEPRYSDTANAPQTTNSSNEPMRVRGRVPTKRRGETCLARPTAIMPPLAAIITATSRRTGNRASPSPSPLRPPKLVPRYIGLKTHFLNAHLPSDEVQLFPFRGGYCGLVMVEEQRVNACLLARYEAFESPESVWQRALQENAALHVALLGAAPAMPWLATANVTFGKMEPVCDGVLRCGDAAGYIQPFTGDGQAMAARGGELAAVCIAAALRGGLKDVDVGTVYNAAWRREFATRLNWGARLQPLLLAPRAGEVAAHLLTIAPGVARLIARRTRGR